jgi:zinc protease
MTREYEKDLKENGYWSGSLYFYLWHNEDPHYILSKNEYIEKIDRDYLMEAANKYLDMDSFKKFILNPED